MESLSRPSHRRKLPSAANGVSFSAKNAYDDVFSTTPKKRGAGPTRAVWDYAEIFGPSRGSSIPVLDLSALEERPAGFGEDFRSSEIDYSNIFGGFADEDIALPYENVVDKRGKQRSSSKARTRSKEQNHFTSNELNEVFSRDSSDQSFDGEKRVNMSYHKTSQGAEDGSNGMTRIAQLHAVPGFTFFIDETDRTKTSDGNVPPLNVKNEVNRKRSFSGEMDKRSSFDGFPFCDNLSNVHESTPEFDPSKVTKPSSLMFNGIDLHTQSKSSQIADPSSLSSDEDLDASSAAAVSAAALKRAIEKAQESIRLAKELMEKHKEGIPVHQKRSSKRSSKVGDKEDRRKGLNSNNANARNTISLKHTFAHVEEAVPLRNVDIASSLKQCEELSTNRDSKSDCHKESVEAPESDAAETWFFEMSNARKHETPAVLSQHVKEQNNNVKTIDETIGLGEVTTKGKRPAEKSPDLGDSETKIHVFGGSGELWANVTNIDSACIMPKSGKGENLRVNNEFEISKERVNIFGDLGNLEKLHKEENIMFQEPENGARVNDLDKPFKTEKEKLEYFECDERQKVVEDVLDCKQITRRVRKTWNKRETELDHSGNGFCFEIEDAAHTGFVEESCNGTHQVSQYGEVNDGRSNGVHMPEIHEYKETERLDEEHVRLPNKNEEACIYEISDEVHKPETHELEGSGNKMDEELVRVEDRVQEVYNNEVITCKESETEERQENQHIGEKKGDEEIEIVERATDTDDEYQEINVFPNGAEEAAYTQSGADDLTQEAANEQDPSPTFSACNGCESYWPNEIQEECTSCEENEGLQGVADTFSKLEEYSMDNVKESKESCNLWERKASDTTGELQRVLEADICHNGRQDTGEDHFCDASRASVSCMKHGQDVPNEREDSETDSLTHSIMQNEREDFEIDSLTNISDNVIGCESDDELEILNCEEVAKSVFSDISFGEKIIAENGKESELSCNAVDGECLRVDESAESFDNEADKVDVEMVHKESCSAESQKEQEPSHFPLNKNEESTVGDEEIKEEENIETSNAKKIFVPEELEIKKSGEKVAEDKGQSSKVEVGKKERERDRDRIVVERAIREARERAFAEARERAAVERATAEVRQRVMAEAREKVGKSSAGSKHPVGKASTDAKLRAERAAVERATAEARERALEKALSQKSTAEVKALAEKLGNEKYSRESVLKHSFSSPDLERFNATTESPQRRKARLERHQRIMERAAKALAEKNMRDLLAQKEQAERNRLAEHLDADIKRWASGKEGNLRALLSTLQYILGPESGWQAISLTEIITTPAVKKAYRKATLCVHPDKLQQRGASIQQKYTCEKVFDMLKAAWNKFNSEER